MASLPHPSDQDWDATLEERTQSAAISADASSDHDDSPAASTSSVEPPPAPAYEDIPLVTINEDDTTELTEPSASEEQLQEAEQNWLF